MTSILVGARIPYAMARDRLFFQGMGQVSAQTRVPVNALVVQAVWISILTLSGSFDTLTDSVIFASWIFYALVTASVFMFRRRRPDVDRPYHTWGYPVTPVIFLMVALWLFISTIITAPVRSLIGLGLMFLGFPLYWYWGGKQRTPVESSVL